MKFTSNYVGAVLMLWGSLHGAATGNLGMAVGFLDALIFVKVMEDDKNTMSFMQKYIKHLELKQWVKP